jgi:hypothetical protein
LVGSGTNADPATTSTADKNFVDIRAETTATSGTNRNIYARTDFSGAGGSGETVRANSVITAAAAGVHGLHGSVEAKAGGSVTGLGAGVRGGFLARDSALAGGGTYCAVHADLYATGASTDISPATEVSLIRCNLDGDATGIANMDDNAFLLTLDGGSNGAGNIAGAAGNEPTWAGVTYQLRCKINGVVGYIPFVSV